MRCHSERNVSSLTDIGAGTQIHFLLEIFKTHFPLILSSLSPDWADTSQPPFAQLATPKYLPRHSKSSYIYIYVDTSLGLCPKKYCASISSTYP